MEYTNLGRTGLKVSRLCLGTMNFGRITSERESFAIMDRALEEGITYFDTANVYGGPDQRGLTEEIVGHWFALGEGRRESVVLGTKVFGPMDEPADGPNDTAGLSAYKIRRSLERSLKRLKTDHIEIYQMHHVDPKVSWDELWGVFQPIVDSGTVDYIGSSNFGARHLCYAQAAAAKRNFLGLVSEQHKFSLMCRAPELELLPAAEDLGIGVICWSPLFGGMLSGHTALPKPGSRTAEAVSHLTEAQHRQLEAYAALCDEIGVSQPLVALAWILTHKQVVAPIIGPRTMEHLTSALDVFDVKLSQEVMDKLDQIFPGPGGPAPEAYAW